MRIIAGKFGGRRLSAFKADHIRPTTDRVKESIFNTWATYMEDASVLDLFSGTGNLALEAISRGAKNVVAVEQNPKSVQIIKKNRDLLGISDELQIEAQDVFKFVKNYLGPGFDLVFIDPPFTQKLAHQAMEELSKSKVFHQDTLFVIESTKQERIDSQYAKLKCYRQKNYGDKNLSFFSVEED